MGKTGLPLHHYVVHFGAFLGKREFNDNKFFPESIQVLSHLWATRTGRKPRFKRTPAKS